MRCSRTSGGTFGMEQSQTFAMRDILHAAAAQEEEEFAPVRLSEPEDNFAAGIVDLALLAVQNDAPDLDRTVWDMVTKQREDSGEGNPQCGEMGGVAGGVLRDGGSPGDQVQRPRGRTRVVPPAVALPVVVLLAGAKAMRPARPLQAVVQLTTV